MKTILEAVNLCKEFRNGRQVQPVLNQVNMAIKQGEFVTIMGSSGSGKSTLLYALSGMDNATSGKVILDEQEITSMKEEELAQLRLMKMGFVFQQNHLLNNLNIEDNILLPAFNANKFDRNEAVSRLDMLMSKMGVSELAHRKVHEASGGQLQRVGICRALINEPDILFGDEPTGALNTSSTLEILDLLFIIHNEGTTIVIVTHDARVASRSERILYMVDGQINNEIILGKYDKSVGDYKAREISLIEWLKNNKF